MDTKGQIHILEVVIVSAMLLLSVLFVVYISAPPSLNVSPSNQLKILCDEALRTLKDMPTGDLSYENSMLVKYIITNDTRNFTSFMNSTLPENVFYQVWVYDGISRKLWYPDEEQEIFGTVVRSHFIIPHNTFIYDVELEVWGI
jgi:hypothetical protein